MFTFRMFVSLAAIWWLLVVIVQNSAYRMTAKQASIVDDNPDLYTGYLVIRPFMLILATGEVACGAWLVWQVQPDSGVWYVMIIEAAILCGIINYISLFINPPAVWSVAAWLGISRPSGLRGCLQDILAGIVAAAAAAWLFGWMAASFVWICAMVSYYIMVRSFDARLNLERKHDGAF